MSCKLSPWETICIKYQKLYSLKNKKKDFNMLSAENFSANFNFILSTSARFLFFLVKPFKVPFRNVADAILKYSFYFSEKIRFDISSELSAKTIHMKCQTKFSMEKNEKKKNDNNRMVL